MKMFQWMYKKNIFIFDVTRFLLELQYNGGIRSRSRYFIFMRKIFTSVYDFLLFWYKINFYLDKLIALVVIVE